MIIKQNAGNWVKLIVEILAIIILILSNYKMERWCPVKLSWFKTNISAVCGAVDRRVIATQIKLMLNWTQYVRFLVRPSAHPPQRYLMAHINVNLILMQMSCIIPNQEVLCLNPIKWICKWSSCHFKVKFVKVSIIADVLVYRFNCVCCTKYNFVKTTMSQLPTSIDW